MRIIVCGGRDFVDRDHLFATLDTLDAEECIDLLVEGGQRKKEGGVIVGGADGLALQWAIERRVPYDTMYAEWNRLGKAAGPIRNVAMRNRWDPDAVVAFPGGTGTAGMMRLALERGIRLIKA